MHARLLFTEKLVLVLFQIFQIAAHSVIVS
jgi:hypothetical protein